MVLLGDSWAPLPDLLPDPEPDPVVEVLTAVRILQEALLSLPAPVVHVAPQDLSDVVSAVQALNGPSGPSASDIGQAVKDALLPALPAPVTPALEAVNGKVLEVLERLDFRMKGQIIAGGPSAVTVNNTATQPVPVRADPASRLPNLSIASQSIAAAAVVTTSFVDVSHLTGLRYTVDSTGTVDGEADWSNDGVTVHHSVGSTFAGAGSFHGPIEAKYVRIRITNTGTSSVTFALETYGLTAAPSQLLFPVGAIIDPSFPAELVKNVSTAQQPDGDYVNAKADGTVFANTTALGAAGVFQSSWFDSDGWRGLEVVVKTDQVSASNGLVIEFTDNVQAATPTAKTSETFTFTAANVTSGFLVIRLPTELDGFRVTYTNGGFAQGAFFIQCDVRTAAGEIPRFLLEADVDATDSASLSRGLVLAKNPASGTYDNVTRGATNGSSQRGLHVSVLEHLAAIPIKRLDSISGNATSVGTTATQVATSAPTNTQSVMLQADSTNTKEIYLGTSNAVTSGNGMHVLPAGASVTFPVGEDQALWAITASGTQTLRWVFGVRSL